LDETEGDIDLAWRKSTTKTRKSSTSSSYLSPTLHTFVSGKTELPRAGHIDAGPHIGSHPIGKSPVNKAISITSTHVSLFHIQVAHAWLITWFSASRTMSLANEFSPVQT